MQATGKSEIMGDGRPENKPGVYRNDDGQEIITGIGDFGRIQADAIVQQGYVLVADVPRKTETKAEEAPTKNINGLLKNR